MAFNWDKGLDHGATFDEQPSAAHQSGHVIRWQVCLHASHSTTHDDCGGWLGGVNVALPTNLAPEDVAKVVNEAELVGVACAADELASLAPVLAACHTLRTFIVMDGQVDCDLHLPALVRQARQPPCPMPCIPCAPSVCQGPDDHDAHLPSLAKQARSLPGHMPTTPGARPGSLGSWADRDMQLPALAQRAPAHTAEYMTATAPVCLCHLCMLWCPHV